MTAANSRIKLPRLAAAGERRRPARCGPSVSGRIVYRSRARRERGTPAGQRHRAAPSLQGAGGFVAGIPLGSLRARKLTGPDADKSRSLYLRTGDIIPSEVTSIDESGVSFRTSLSDEHVRPARQGQGRGAGDRGRRRRVRLTKAKRERLLTLPRMQKENPPTHLIRSRNGDYLRGRLIKMDDKTLQVEVRLETKDIPRDRISRRSSGCIADELDRASKGRSHAPTSARRRGCRRFATTASG